MTDFASILIKSIKDEDTSLATEAKASAEFDFVIDTGSYTLNALLMGSIYGGMPDNKVLGIAGETTTGKTYFAIGICRQFLEDFPNGIVLYYDTEGAVTNDMFEERGIDLKRVIRAEKRTAEELKIHAAKILQAYNDTDPKTRPRMMVVLDSLGNLGTLKEIEDALEGKIVKDMGRAVHLKSMFRVMNFGLRKGKIPMIVTNHTYTDVMAYGAPQKMGGGSGLKFLADMIIMIAKSKDKDTDESIRGAIVRMMTEKNRFAKQYAKLETRILFDRGLDRYYGLIPLAVDSGVWTKAAKGFNVPGYEKPQQENAIYKNPEKYFTKEVLDKIDEYVKEAYKYGTNTEVSHSDSDESDRSDTD